MKSNSLLILLYSWMFAFLFVGCSTCPEELTFLINGKDVLASENEPSDSTAYYTAYLGQELAFADASDPIQKVSARLWDLTGDGEWDTEYQDQDNFLRKFDQTGMHRIVFCANKEACCVTKWVKIIENDTLRKLLAPKVNFSSPKDMYTSSKERSLPISVNTKNIFSPEELKLLVNEQEKDFRFDAENGTLSRKVNLARGENKIEVLATTEDGTVSRFVFVEYKKGRDNNREGFDKVPPLPPIDELPGPDPVPRKVNEVPSVRFTYPGPNYRTKVAQQEVRIKSKNLLGKNDLSILLNGAKVNAFKFDSAKQVWVAMLNLKEGKNTVEVVAANGRGKASDKIVIDYEAPPIDLTNLETAGLKIQQRKISCVSPSSENYTFSISPKQSIELLAFTVYSSICGGLEIQLQSSAGQSKTTTRVPLVKGKNQISLDDLRARLEPGTEYFMSCKTLSGYGNCKTQNKPKLEDASACQIQPTSKSAFQVDYQGKSIIYELKYLY